MSVSLRFKATAIAVTAFLSCSVVAAQQNPQSSSTVIPTRSVGSTSPNAGRFTSARR